MIARVKREGTMEQMLRNARSLLYEPTSDLSISLFLSLRLFLPPCPSRYRSLSSTCAAQR